MEKLGKPWAFLDPGTWIKPYPCGSLTHPAMTALIELAKQHDIKPAEVASVRVRSNRRVQNTLVHNRPKSALQAKFSMQFAVAISLVRRQATLAEFTDEVVASPAIQALMAKIDYDAYEGSEPGYTNVTTLIDVAMTDGRRFALRADFGKGNPLNPMSFADLAEKFRGCAAYAGWPGERTEAVIERVQSLENLADVRAITRLMSRQEER
jgi:2-methylcitrate dehydratase PrpD